MQASAFGNIGKAFFSENEIIFIIFEQDSSISANIRAAFFWENITKAFFWENIRTWAK